MGKDYITSRQMVQEQPQTEMPRIAITIEEAAKIVGIGRCFAYQLAQRGEFPVRRIGRRIVVPVKALDEWLAQRN